MRRRDFVTMLGGAVTTSAAGLLAAKAEPRERMRRIGVLLPGVADDPGFQARYAAFLQGLALLGWTVGRNVAIDTRWATTAVKPRRRVVQRGRAVIILKSGGEMESQSQLRCRPQLARRIGIRRFLRNACNSNSPQI